MKCLPSRQGRKRRLLLRGVIALLLALTLITPARADDERGSTTPTGWWWLHGVSADQIKERIDQGFRLIDLEVEQTSPLRFSAVFVKNQGVHQKTWWWYFGATRDFLASKLQQHRARLLDLEPYEVNGQTRFAAVLVRNTGSQAKAWWWYWGVSTTSFITSKLSQNGARLIDIDTYFIGGQRRYSAVMIRNAGADAKAWWWYFNVSPSFIASKLQQHRARLVDIERHTSSTFTVIMERSQGEPWWWYYGVSGQQVNELLAQNGARLIDIESYRVNGQKRFAVLMLNNSNALTTRVGQMLRAGTDGASGLYLKRINGPVLASLQATRAFEPASAIKVLIHVHAMLQVQNGNVTLQTQVPWKGDPSKYNALGNYMCGGNDCYSDNTVDESDALEDALRLMMECSDNALTQALRDFFGDAHINATRQMLGMTNTRLRHSIGCGQEAVNNPNRLTLVDVGRLHEKVATGLLTPTNRETFYDLMLNGLFPKMDDIIAEEAVALGLSKEDEDAFRSEVDIAYKGGSYGLPNGKSYRSVAGWVQLPFISNGSLSHRQYVFGIFIDRATTININVRDAASELLRDEIRAALETFKP